MSREIVKDADMVPGKLHRTQYPGIYKRRLATDLKNGKPQIVWVAVWRDRDKKQRKEAFRTRDEALARQGKKRDRAERQAPAHVLFRDYARTWIAGHNGRRGRFSEVSRQAYAMALEEYAIPHFGHQRLSDIDVDDVRAFIRKLEAKGLKPSTVTAYVKPVRALFATAVEDRKLSYNPTNGAFVNKNREEDFGEAKVKAMTREELRQVLDKMPERDKLFFEFLVETGLRIGEALGVEVRDVQLLDIGAHVRIERQLDREGKLRPPKSRAGKRKVPLSRSMAAKLRPLCEAGEGPLFRYRTGEPVRHYALRDSLYLASGRKAKIALEAGIQPQRKTLDHADVPWISFHTFRHTCASILFESGKNIKQVAAWLGHEDPGFTLRTYVHLMDEGIGDASCMEDKFLPTVATAGQQATPDLGVAARLSLPAETAHLQAT
jgi:integrase